MKIDKDKLKRLQGLIPCTSSVTFTPSVYDELIVAEGEDGYEEYLEIRDIIPTFTCDALTISEGEAMKAYGASRIKAINEGEMFTDKKDRLLEIVESKIKGWDNLYDMATGEELKFSQDLIKELPENTLESIMMDLGRYAGIVSRGI